MSTASILSRYTLSQLRQGLPYPFRPIVGTVTTGAAGNIIDTNMLQGPMNFANSWLFTFAGTGANQLRKINTYDSATSKLTPYVAFTTTPDATTRYEAYRVAISPLDLRTTINDAIDKAYPYFFRSTQDTSLTTAINTWYYTVPSSIQDVTKIELQTVTNFASYPYETVDTSDWHIDEDAETATKRIQFTTTLPSSRTLRVTGQGKLQHLGPMVTVNGALSAAATTVPVNVAITGDMSYYPTSGTIIIESEQITYTGTTSTSFTGCTRGALGTTAATHADKTPVEAYELMPPFEYMVVAAAAEAIAYVDGMTAPTLLTYYEKLRDTWENRAVRLLKQFRMRPLPGQVATPAETGSTDNPDYLAFYNTPAPA